MSFLRSLISANKLNLIVLQSIICRIEEEKIICKARILDIKEIYSKNMLSFMRLNFVIFSFFPDQEKYKTSKSHQLILSKPRLLNGQSAGWAIKISHGEETLRAWNLS